MTIVSILGFILVSAYYRTTIFTSRMMLLCISLFVFIALYDEHTTHQRAERKFAAMMQYTNANVVVEIEMDSDGMRKSQHVAVSKIEKKGKRPKDGLLISGNGVTYDVEWKDIGKVTIDGLYYTGLGR